jgi:hypothetical protein
LNSYLYYPEIEQLLKKATGAEKVVVFDHQVRNIQLYKRGEKQARDYASTVHNDYTAKSGPRRVRDHLRAEEAEQRLQHRFAEINVWRAIRGPTPVGGGFELLSAMTRAIRLRLIHPASTEGREILPDQSLPMGRLRYQLIFVAGIWLRDS